MVKVVVAHTRVSLRKGQSTFKLYRNVTSEGYVALSSSRHEQYVS
jgi:hypothetical protein